MPEMFVLVPVFIGIIAVVIFGTILYAIVRGITQWAYNNGQPILTVPAQVVAKRTNHSVSTGAETGTSVSTTYYATFEMADGGRTEFSIQGREYGLLAEGDRGTLTYQGTRYKGFARDLSASGS